jgi:hypothetical protein
VDLTFVLPGTAVVADTRIQGQCALQYAVSADPCNSRRLLRGVPASQPTPQGRSLNSTLPYLCAALSPASPPPLVRASANVLALPLVTCPQAQSQTCSVPGLLHSWSISTTEQLFTPCVQCVDDQKGNATDTGCSAAKPFCIVPDPANPALNFCGQVRGAGPPPPPPIGGAVGCRNPAPARLLPSMFSSERSAA